MQKAVEVITANRIKITARELVLVTARATIAIPWERCSAKLASASAVQRRQAELSPGGYGIHWPLLDEDLSVSALVKSWREAQQV